MKKALLALATTVLMTGAAFAEGVTLSGTSKAGVVEKGMGVAFYQDVDVTFSMAGTMDNGLTFGADVDLSNFNKDPQAFTVFVSGPFGNVTMGDIDGGFDWAMMEVDGGVGSLNDAHMTHDGWSGNDGLDGDGTVVRYDNSISEIGFAVSMAQSDELENNILGVGVMSSFVGVDVGLGYQQDDETNVMGASAAYSFAPVKGILNYSVRSKDGEDDMTHLGVGVTYEADLLAVNVNYGSNGDNETGYGVAANYDLGGGAVAQFGYGSKADGDDDDNVWSLGLAMSF